MSVLLTLSAGGIMLFSLYGSQREMQKAADQAALAAAAGLPLLNPSQTLDGLALDYTYELLEGYGLDSAVQGATNIPDPRAVACAYANRNLQGDTSRLVAKFGEGYNAGGSCAGHVSGDARVNVTLGSLTSELSQCLSGLTPAINSLTTQLTTGLNNLLARPLIGLLGITLGTVGDVVNGLLPASLLAPLGLNLSQVNTLVQGVPNTIDGLDNVIESVQNLEALTPALLTPEVTVTVTERVTPPLMSMVGGGDGVRMTVSATAERRLKNVVVLPDAPLLGVDLSSALNAAKPDILSTLTSVNTQLNTVMSTLQGLGLGNVAGCQNLLGPASQIYQDIDSLYSPPASAPFTGADLVAGAMDSVIRIAGDSGAAIDDVAGEAFLVIAEGGPTPTTLQNLLGASAGALGLSSTLNSLPIPALDVALVAAHHLESGDPLSEEMMIDTLSARGLFTAVLVQ
jgi:Flp pilus assembly protein TadG